MPPPTLAQAAIAGALRVSRCGSMLFLRIYDRLLNFFSGACVVAREEVCDGRWRIFPANFVGDADCTGRGWRHVFVCELAASVRSMADSAHLLAIDPGVCGLGKDVGRHAAAAKPRRQPADR